MEYVDGKNALQWVRALPGPLPIASAARIGRLLLSALHYAHSRGYVHRDIKPSNLLVMGPAHRPLVKLSDFGLAKSLVEPTLCESDPPGRCGRIFGFLSPEHIRQFGEVREAADIYCAGSTLFFLLTEKYPFLGFDPRRPDAYEMVLEHPPVPIRAFRPDAPEGLERVLLKALKTAPRPLRVGPGHVAGASPLRRSQPRLSWCAPSAPSGARAMSRLFPHNAPRLWLAGGARGAGIRGTTHRVTVHVV